MGDDKNFMPEFVKADSPMFYMSGAKPRKFGPIRCEDCGQFVSVTQQVTHWEKCPNPKPMFTAKPAIEWIVETNPCGEQPLD